MGPAFLPAVAVEAVETPVVTAAVPREAVGEDHQRPIYVLEVGCDVRFGCTCCILSFKVSQTR